MSRQTLGRPAMAAESFGGPGAGQETLNARADGGATIVTQFNRDNLEDSMAIPANDEIDDLRRA